MEWFLADRFLMQSLNQMEEYEPGRSARGVHSWQIPESEFRYEGGVYTRQIPESEIRSEGGVCNCQIPEAELR